MIFFVLAGVSVGFALPAGPTPAAHASLAEPGKASRDAPHVVATSPARGDRIAAGRFTLSVTFDRPMAPGRWSFTTPDGRGAYPDCGAEARQSDDGRTFWLSCVARAGHHYAIGFNGGRFRNFVSADGRVPAEPATLRFAAR